MKKTPITPFTKIPESLFSLFLFSMVAAGCSQNNDNENTKITGRYINETFLGSVSDSIPGLIPVYCYEMNFSDADSVDILYGFEQAKLAYKKSGDKYLLVKALKDKDMVFTLNDDHTITLIDSAWNGATKNSQFKAAKGDTDFIHSLNQQIIAGEYNLFSSGKIAPQKVVFSADGAVKGLENFTRYTICYSGDCMGEIYPISNSITLSNDKNEALTFAFKKDKERKTLSIYHIEAPVQDIKGERAIKGIAFDLRQ
ncbi:hypothetical protein [Dyadobacter diqingensis]|uniref:hypothetical protein n=1 Tax=Dyadobacter diqingensis TaxID=2938121 RepID=UPI0020C5233A|nr:hypothetical protein [Dyadobacter diqingensis]